MFKCGCGGILIPIAVEQFPSSLSNKKVLEYERVCDVECQKCGEVYYSQPYDNDKKQLSLIKETTVLKFKSPE